ncbi:MAG: hypothetical protein SCALA702_03330 [Melioribacteraceae bacterium]|nr:MAG: hypothetical protein SCALA702_03330 [Melioribacteraceae bacterium]
MKIFNSILAVLVLSLGSLSAQTFIGKLNPNPPAQPQKTSNNTYNILAVMVEFQEDNDGATFGTGKFGSIYSGENTTRKDIIDPLPHDKAYFENHLLFAKNYFNRVSNGQADINYTVFDQIITVSQTMRNYSPLPKSDDLENVVDFAEEVWTIAEANYSGNINFGDYDIYAIFHAGVGRDVSLPGSIGNERDLPSVYLSNNTFKQYLGDTFEGFTGNGNPNVINNTMIIPCTESREIDAVSGIFLLELSINGLIAASIGSHMGLPDLFNTETGLSAIGRFALMDGQSIFTYGGLFPPEPSPWEKMYLGWITPETVQNGTNYVSLAAKLAAEPGDTVYLKVPINESEYYLVENRARDVNNDNVTITIISEGNTETLYFDQDTTGFQSFEIDSAKGVVIDVDEYDWAVPGSGVVIWHIDENIIYSKLASNTINNDKDYKGVDVEEADGIQDIGERFFTVFGDEVIGEGSEDDLWYSSNESELYENRFSADTKPNTNSNDGANSLITFDNFSDISNKMSFVVSNGSNGISLNAISDIPNFDSNTPVGLSGFIGGTSADGYMVWNNNALSVYALNGILQKYEANFSKYKPVQLPYLGGTGFIGVTENKISLMYNNVRTDLPVHFVPSTNPVVITDLYIGASNGYVYTYEIDPNNANVFVIKDSVKFFDTPIEQLGVNYNSTTNLIVAASSGNEFKIGNNPLYNADAAIKQFTLSTSSAQSDLALLLTDDNIIILKNGVYDREINLGEFENCTGMALWHVGDASPENLAVFVSKGDKIGAWNMSGAAVDHFPIKVTNQNFVEIPSVVKAKVNQITYIYSVTEDGKIYAFNTTDGKLVDGYPLSLGTSSYSSPSIFVNSADETFINLISTNGKVYSYQGGFLSELSAWNGLYGGNNNSGFVKNDSYTSKQFSFDEARAYNWPNPVYEDVTYIRYYVGDDSSVEIKIFDIAGDLVAELSDEATGGFDNETVWNVSDIQSGVYFAHLNVTGNSGGSATKIIKIAVIK